MDSNKMCVYNKETPPEKTQYVQQKNGIPKERIINYKYIIQFMIRF